MEMIFLLAMALLLVGLLLVWSAFKARKGKDLGRGETVSLEPSPSAPNGSN